ncbi:AAA family ATPase [Streptomyces sp. SID8374]|uniref:DnaB-like helicase C-terminal domain-containing protein n=1 Tax=Streptomyces sp. SID8374 TaxID=2690354 RepID=UPI001367A88B|nr:DnaB-like helicase C-terminal domain-containing protein [Streptomyces sp. SID8374]MYX18427.1 AAA family ATPase [Streptomyces sp. SID8374]
MIRPPLFTGLSDFDALAGPLPAGKVTAVAGRPSAGTSAFALTVARHNLADGRAVAFTNLQVDHGTLLGNFLAAESSTNVDRWETLNEGRITRLRRASDSLSETRLWTWTPRDLRRPEQIVQELDQVEDVDLIIVDDYAMAADGELAKGATLAVLRQIAEDRQAAVLVTAHLERTEWGQERTVPSLADLLPGDAALVDATAAIVLHRPDTDGTVPERRGEADIIAAHGWQRSGTVPVRFEPEYHRLVDRPNDMASARPGS